MTNSRWENFTEAAYQGLLELTLKNYKIVGYFDRPTAPHAIWRHDVDFSPHRALRLAEIEKSYGVCSTFFFLATSPFYNVFESEVAEKIFAIRDLGHEIGLHFDLNSFSGKVTDETSFLKYLGTQKILLEQLLGQTIRVFSLHNPGECPDLQFNQDEYAGLLNVYSKTIAEQYKYCSDSNGYWRFDDLADLLKKAQHERLHILTHPAWWSLEPMPPRAKIVRCAEGRAQRTIEQYDLGLKRFNRENIAE